MGSHLDETRTELDTVQDHLDDHNSLHVRYNRGVAGGIIRDKGDLMTFHEDDFHDRLGVGVDGTVLTADSTMELGVKWDWPVPHTHGGGDIADPLSINPNPQPEDDDFSGATLDPKWTRITQAVPLFDVAQNNGRLNYYPLEGTTYTQELDVMSTPYAASPGDTLHAGFEYFGEGSSKFGAFFGFATGTEWGVDTANGCTHNSQTSVCMHRWWQFTYAQSTSPYMFHGPGGVNYEAWRAGPIHMKLQYEGNNNYNMSYSRFGNHWQTSPSWNAGFSSDGLPLTHVMVGSAGEGNAGRAYWDELMVNYFWIEKA